MMMYQKSTVEVYTRLSGIQYFFFFCQLFPPCFFCFREASRTHTRSFLPALGPWLASDNW